MAKTELGLDENVEGALAYIFGIVTGLIFFLAEKENKFVRFHGMQSILFSAVLIGIGFLVGILSTVLSAIPVVGWIAGILMMLATPLMYLGGLIVTIFLLIKAYQGNKFKLPWLGDIAEEKA